MSIPDCLIIASALYENYFQYSSAPLTELINKNTFTFKINFLTLPAASVPGLILYINNHAFKFIP